MLFLPPVPRTDLLLIPRHEPLAREELPEKYSLDPISAWPDLVRFSN
jgi:hypothetical protein